MEALSVIPSGVVEWDRAEDERAKSAYPGLLALPITEKGFPMATIAFDTFENVKRLKAVGFTEEQVAEQTKIIGELIENRLATKQDIEFLRQNMEERLVVLEANVTAKIIKWVCRYAGCPGGYCGHAG